MNLFLVLPWLRIFSEQSIAPVAQSDRVSGFGPEGWRFESSREHHVGKVKEFWFASRSLFALSADSVANLQFLGVEPPGIV